ncbi:MAG: ABC transporter permease [Propioniciclava sp.]|uniref:FtsX-like permease family protein n=1 Tax=Propioniciclava sp. TaxID=2038686 RepID=UPI0039E4C0C7
MAVRTSMNVRYALNDLRKGWGVSLALVVTLTLCAFLMAAGAMVMERSAGAVDRLFSHAKPPHFLQMHTGEYDPAAVEAFANGREEIGSWLIEEMIGVDSSALAWGRPATGETGSIADSLIDNLFVTQNDTFDFLLDEADRTPRPQPGEVYVPVAYQQRFALRAGDELRMTTAEGVRTWTIAGFVRDAQMASSLSSATRFLIGEADFAHLVRDGVGVPEIIVEFRLHDPAGADALQTAYTADSALPRNGQAVTDSMIRMINAISGGLVAFALVFVGVLLIGIALLCVRFVIRGTVQDEVREIGAMKAIGLPHSTIAAMYLAKYVLLALAACLAGGLAAAPAAQALTADVRRSYGQAVLGPATVLAPALALAVMFALVIGICRGVLNGVGRIEVVGALVHGTTLTERGAARQARRRAGGAHRSAFASFRGGDVNRVLALTDLRADARQWALITLVFGLAAVLMILPTNLLSTLTSPRFVTYLGAADSDLRVDLQFADQLDATRAALLTTLERDDRVASAHVYGREMHEAEGPEGWETLRVDVGDHATSVEFLHGRRPLEGEIALSVLNAERFGVGVGDTLAVRDGAAVRTPLVSGIYQDVTSGGRTAKMQGQASTGASGYVIYLDLAEGADPAAVAAEYDGGFPGASFVPMRAYTAQTLSYVTDGLMRAAVLASVFALGVALLMSYLYLDLRRARERSRTAILAVLGFSGSELAAQIRLKTLIAVTVGVTLGVLAAATAGEALVSAALSAAGIGITRLSFLPNPWLVYLAYPLLLLGVGAVSAATVGRKVRGADVSRWLS